MKKIAVIDPFIVSPSLTCYNRLVDELDAKLHYHHPQESLATLERLPADGYIVLGSASHVTLPLPWHAPLANFLEQKLKRGHPVLGICFGHQLMCHHFGGQVDYYVSEDVKLTGVREVLLTQDAFGLARGTRLSLAIRHKQVVKSLPQELQEVGTGLAFDLVQHKSLPFLGTQPHPEASAEFCSKEPAILSEEQVQRALSDGMQLIKAFFRHHQILGSIS